MRNRIRAFSFCCLVFAMLPGCSGDTTTPENPVPAATGVASGVIGDSDFEIRFADAGSPNAPYEGPFVLRGTNLHYDADAGVLVVDLTVRNDSDDDLPLPVTLTFTRLLPDGVTVENPDNDEHGAGAMIVFHFTDRDVVWSPGEESQPRTVEFGVDEGVSIGFTVRLDVGTPPSGGAISGVVFFDGNRNGEQEASEPGLASMQLELVHDGPSPETVVQMWRALTDESGHFEFPGLRAGSYTLTKTVFRGTEPTTPTVLHILLTESDGVVGSFDEADFGCIVPPDFYWIRPGDYVRVKGTFYEIPYRIFGEGTELVRCRPPFVDCEPVDPDCPCSGGVQMLRGPVTNLPEDGYNAIEVMGLPMWVAVFGSDEVDYSIDPKSLEVGDLVETEIWFAIDGTAIARTLHEWTGDHVEVHGTVRTSFRGHSEALPQIMLFGNGNTIPGVKVIFPYGGP